MSSNTRNNHIFTEAVTGYFKSKNELEERLSYTLSVLTNTRRKLTLPIPEEFAFSSAVKTSDYAVLLDGKNITQAIIAGEIELMDEMELQFKAASFRLEGTYSISFAYLKNDPIRVSQWLRKAVRAAAEKANRDYPVQLAQEQLQLQADLAKTKRSIEEHQRTALRTLEDQQSRAEEEIRQTQLKIETQEPVYKLKPTAKERAVERQEQRAAYEARKAASAA